jgi:2-C-methyl-D-erythritol 2,4-cyclodiphosphate synthase/2-C-methyl-D-erythritol 4-phosphate cytidylyltransferase
MGAKVPKQYLEVNGASLIHRTLTVFSELTYVKEVVIACSPEYAKSVLAENRQLFAPDVIFRTVDGGSERQDSVRNALLSGLQGTLTAIHDAVRPSFDAEIMERVCEAAHEFGAAIPALPAKETVKESVDGIIIDHTIPRSRIWLAQTPQVFHTQLIVDAHTKAFEEGFRGTDDASLVEYVGQKVILVPGKATNIKITEPADLDYIHHVMNQSSNFDVRIGYGYDVHRLEPDRKLMLGGIQVPHEKGLLGHSDADALLHAITDAIIGAMALGDIGSHFPDTDAAYKNMDSAIFLQKAVELAYSKGYKVGNVDATIVAEKPKLRPHIDRMRERIAHILETDIDRISVKATTSERMGFVGRQEGMAAMATVLMTRS